MARMTIQIPETSEALLEKVAQENATTKVEILRRLLALLRVSEEEKVNGNVLAIVSTDNQIVSRLIGL